MTKNTKSKILIVEDEAVIAMRLQQILSAMGYHTFGISYSSEDAIKKARDLKPDLVLMDIMIPGELDGIDAAKIMRSELDIPVIFLTAFSDDKTIRRARHAEPFGYILKPFQDRELFAAVEVALYKKDMEKALTESQKNFEALAENANDGILIAIRDAECVYANKRASEITGYSTSELLKLTFIDLAHPDEFEKIIKRYRTIISGKPFKRTYETIFIRKDRKEIPLEVTSARSEWKGQPADIVIIRDISVRKRTEEKLKESKAMFKAIIESLPFDVFALDRNNRYILQNAICKKNWGDLIGKTPENAAIERHTKQTWGENNRRALSGETISNEVMYEKLNGEKDYYYNIITPIRDKENIYGILGVVIDITERKQTEEELKKSQDELERRVHERTNELRLKTEHLEEINTAMKVLLKKREEDKKQIEDNVLTNVKSLISPYIEKIKKMAINERQQAFVEIVELNLNEITSSFNRRMTLKYLNLTPQEVRIANLIRHGSSSKEIADIMNISLKTVETHRKNIRNKVGLKSKRANLRTHLLSLH